MDSQTVRRRAKPGGLRDSDWETSRCTPTRWDQDRPKTSLHRHEKREHRCGGLHSIIALVAGPANEIRITLRSGAAASVCLRTDDGFLWRVVKCRAHHQTATSGSTTRVW